MLKTEHGGFCWYVIKLHRNKGVKSKRLYIAERKRLYLNVRIAWDDTYLHARERPKGKSFPFSARATAPTAPTAPTARIRMTARAREGGANDIKVLFSVVCAWVGLWVTPQCRESNFRN
jgi:hypothetical protein